MVFYNTDKLNVLMNDLYQNEFRLYQASHMNKWNIFIHHCTVPLEWFSCLVFISLSHVIFTWILTMLVIICLLVLRSKNKYSACFCHLILCAGATITANTYNPLNKIKLSCILQIIAWFLQVCIGHFLIERNSPSMTKQLTMFSVTVSLLLAFDV